MRNSPDDVILASGVEEDVGVVAGGGASKAYLSRNI